jgi:hypothetical protein
MAIRREKSRHMDIKQFRATLDSAFREEGFGQQRWVKGYPKYWTLPADDIIPFFAPHAQRRPWGFVLYGSIGIEIPALREWLNRYKPGQEAGIFQTMFAGYHTANENVLSFMIDQGDPVPADLWAGLIKDRLLLIPPSVDKLITTYRSQRENLGWLAHPRHKHAGISCRNGTKPPIRICTCPKCRRPAGSSSSAPPGKERSQQPRRFAFANPAIYIRPMMYRRLREQHRAVFDRAALGVARAII